MSGKAIRETLGVIASMMFVGWEIKESNTQATGRCLASDCYRRGELACARR